MWSITYHSWLTFAFLLTACMTWMMPSKRHFCLLISPLIVCYTEALLTVGYIYGFNLTDEELPSETESGYKLEEIGLVKYEYPCVHLAVQIAFSIAFWLTLRQHMREVSMRKQELYMHGLSMANLGRGGGGGGVGNAADSAVPSMRNIQHHPSQSASQISKCKTL